MKSLLALAALLLGVRAMAQPQISYLIPDLGTSRFATYIEIIGPASLQGNFGPDGIYANNPGDAVRVVPARSADTAIVNFGPCVVSWNGRMVATHAFVKPTAQPNSEDWRLLQPQFRIPVQVVVNGVASSTVDTFYVVRPWTFGDKRAEPERVLGAGRLGVRSPRGAMLIDNALLAGLPAYTVSTSDCDPARIGNQGFLPFTMLSKGTIDAVTGSQIRVDGQGATGGPGGGGGGGGYGNAQLVGTGGPQGTNGGDGFTGGGPGGRNNNSNPLTGQSSKRKPGDGSGEAPVANNARTFGGSSLNGVPGGESKLNTYQNAGGGTGHPFGKSGDAWSGPGDDAVMTGFYGGGSGHGDGRKGGAGGFGTDGSADAAAPATGGRIHGNTCLVPLAGGSGGASGNPANIGDESSQGGGGGGAISIHADRLTAFTVFAQGGVPSRVGVGGGCGSGGGIVLGTRLDNAALGFVSAQAIGGDDMPAHTTGGNGRTRYDARTGTSPGYYVGPMTDTLTNSLRRVTYRGAGNGQDEQIWIKPENGPWATGPLTSGSPSWITQFTLNGTDTLYYVMVAQRVPTPTNGQFASEPQWVLSQSAWNIIRIYRPPVIDANTTLVMDQYKCPRSVSRDTVWVHNRGESPLEITSATFGGAPGFRLARPSVFPDSILAFDSAAYVIEFQPQTGQSGVQSTTLTLDNNDPVAARDPYRVTITIDVQAIDLTYTARGVTRDTVDLGTVCAGTPLQEPLTITNVGTADGVVTGIRSSNPNVVQVTATYPVALNAGANGAFVIAADARITGPTVVPLYVDLQGCPEPDTFWVRLTALAPQVTVVGSGQFGVVRVGDTRQVQIQLRNDGTSNLSFTALPAVNAPFSIVGTTPAIPTTVPPGRSLVVTLAYAPTAVGEDSATLVFSSTAGGLSCVDSAVVAVAGRAIASQLRVEPGSLVFGDVARCATKLDSVTITNDGAAPVTLLYPAFINGPDAAAFTIVRQETNDVTLAQGESATFVIDFGSALPPDGVKTAILSVRTDDPTNPRVDVPLSANQLGAAINGPVVLDLGNVQLGTPINRQVNYGNTGTTPINITNVRTSSPLLVVSPVRATIPGGGAQTFDVTFVVNAEGPIEDTIFFSYDTPCQDSFMLVVRANGVSGSITAPTLVEFGTLSNCETKRDSITYVNNSGVQLDLIDVRMTGPDAALFRIENPAVVTNVLLDPGQQVVLYVTFDPRNVPDGRKTADVQLRIRLNNQPTNVLTTVTGTRQTTLPGAPNAIAFGAIDLTATSTQRLTLVNNGTAPVRITSATFRGAGGGVFTLAPGTPLPAVIPPGGSITFDVQFTPTAEQAYADSVVLAFDQPCPDQRIVPVSGIGRLNVEISIILPKDTVDPSTEDYQIPIRARVATGASAVSGARLLMTLRYASPVFAARELTAGTITRNEVINGMAYVDIDVPSVSIGQDTSVITALVGDATLGSVDSTDLEIVDARMTAPTILPTLRTNDGYLVLEICREGGDRLIDRAGGLSIIATPNPASDKVDLQAEVFEPGEHALQIITLTGEVIASATWRHVRGDAPYLLPVNAASLPSGIYHIVLRTPTRHRVLPLNIVH